ncbi:MAG: DUF2911 domain-containing protein [Ferruginibacter sp.]
MKKLFLALCMFSAATVTTAQVKMPAPSPGQTIKQEFGLGSVEVMYSRPSIKGRKIFGDLVPYNKLWRTGANSSSHIKFTDAVEMGGKRIDTGTYALYTIPGEDMWEIIINKGTDNWGIDGYKESEDVVRFKVPSKKIKPALESFTMQFANITPENCELHIMWDKTAVAVPIKSVIKDRIRADIEKAMLGEKKPYWNAAQFYFEYDKNNAKALENVTAATAAQPKAFWMWLYKAKIEKEMGNKEAAMASSKTSIELARAAKNDDYVKMNEDLQKKLK